MVNSYWRMILLFTVLLAIPTLCHAWPGEVVHVADGDTITVMKGEKRVKIRLYGIDTPEKRANGTGRTPGPSRHPKPWERRLMSRR